MPRIYWLVALVLLAVFAASPNTLLKFSFFADDIFMGVKTVFMSIYKEEVRSEEEIRFVGDVMLARHVETLMRRNGANYPYHLMDTEPQVKWIGNFEGTVPNVHKQTEDYTFSFSVDKEFLPQLKEFGFTHFSLANNHTNDFGTTVFAETQNNLSDFEVFGVPNGLHDDSLSYINLDESVVGLIGIHATNDNALGFEYEKYIDELVSKSDLQIAYIHWGDEYEPEHNKFQEQLAVNLVSLGIDVIIGHHPHVVQDIDYIQGKPVFYSLGNFIFDQYFDVAVQEGLVVSLKMVNTGFSLQLIPVTTVNTQAAPKVMTETETKEFLRTLANRSDSDIYFDILAKEIIVPAE